MGALLFLAAAALAARPAADTAVPFVGCAGDGQTGPVEAPGPGATPAVPAAAAARLAYYASRSLGVLAPRGWHCFEVHGSDQSILYVAPEPLSYGRLQSWKDKLSGPAVTLSRTYGGTSGRFGVVPMIARLFPAHAGFIGEVEKMGFEIGPLPNGPYPSDRLERLSPTEVRFTTPARSAGLGTVGALDSGSGPVEGLIILLPEEDMDLVSLRVRLAASRPRRRGRSWTPLRWIAASARKEAPFIRATAFSSEYGARVFVRSQ